MWSPPEARTQAREDPLGPVEELPAAPRRPPGGPGPHRIGGTQRLRQEQRPPWCSLVHRRSRPALSTAVQPRDLTSADEQLEFEVAFDAFSDDERAAFPDEIDVGPPETLTIRLEARIEAEDPSVVVVERRFPHSGHNRNISRAQLEVIGWRYVPATRSAHQGTGHRVGRCRPRPALKSRSLHGRARLRCSAGQLSGGSRFFSGHR